MVEFCTDCGQSLPKGDLVFRAGKAFTPSDYRCPHCGKLANPDAPDHDHNQPIEADPAKDIVIKKGKAAAE